MALTKEQRKALSEALAAAFPRVGDLHALIRDELDENPHTILAEGTLSDKIAQLLEWSEATNSETGLVAAALSKNSKNRSLREVARLFGAEAPAGPEERGTPR